MDVISISAATIIAVIGGVISYAGYIRSKTRDKTERSAELARMQERIESLDREIAEVKIDMKDKNDETKDTVNKIYEKLDRLTENFNNFARNANN